MATVTREREALIERLTNAVARLPERHELGDVRDAIAAALAAPPAEDRPAAPPRDVLDGPRPTTALDREYQKALAVIHDQRQEIERLKARAQSPPASDPPGLVEVVKRLQDAENEWDGSRAAGIRLAEARGAVLAYPLPASPQAETMPTIQIGDIVQVGESTGVIDSASKATFWSQQVLDAIYRDPLWRRPTTGDK